MTHLYSPSNAARKTTIWAIPILVIVFTLGGQILALLPAKHLNLISKENIETYPHILYLITGSFTAVAIIFALWIRFFERRDFASVGFVTSASPRRHYLLGMLTAALMSGAIVLGVVIMGGYVVKRPNAITAGALVPIAVLLFAFALQSATKNLYSVAG